MKNPPDSFRKAVEQVKRGDVLGLEEEDIQGETQEILDALPDPEYYEVHILYTDLEGETSDWCGHTAATKEQAIEAAEAAMAVVTEQKYYQMEVFACHLIETIPLNP